MKANKLNESDLNIYIKKLTIPIDQVDDDLDIFKSLSKEIYEGKALLKSNSVQFIIIKILSREGKPINIKKKDSFNVYVIGDFRKTFSPVLRVAEAFAKFYTEMGILPNIIPLPKYILSKDKRLLYKIKNGVLLYERR